MREEILRMERICCGRNGVTLIENMHITLRKGETMGLLIKNAHRRLSVVSLLRGKLQVDSGRIYFGDQLIDPDDYGQLSQRRIATISAGPELIDTLSVAENIFLMRPGVRTYFVRKRRLHRQAAMLLSRFRPQMDPASPVSRLTTLERMIVQLVKAYASGARVVLLSDLSRALGPLEIDALMRCVALLKEEGMGVFLADAYFDVLTKYTDRLSVFSSRSVVKVFRKETYDDGALSALLEDRSAQPAARRGAAERSAARAALSFQGVHTRTLRNVSFQVAPGEVVSVLDMDGSGIDQIAALLMGECGLLSGRILLGTKQYTLRSQDRAIRQGLAIVGDDPTHTSLFRDHSVMDNLSLPISSRMWGFFTFSRFRRSLRAQCRAYFSEEILSSSSLHPLNEEILQRIVYVRWQIMRPKVIVLVRPLSMTDAASGRVVRESIAGLAEAGSAVLVLSSNVTEARMFGHRVLELREGHITAGL